MGNEIVMGVFVFPVGRSLMLDVAKQSRMRSFDVELKRSARRTSRRTARNRAI